MKPLLVKRLGVVVSGLLLGACPSSQRPDTADAGARRGASGPMLNQLTGGERSDGWRLLFDGETLDGWRVYRGQAQPGGWFVKDGALTKVQATGDIISRDQFGDFELALDWKLQPGGNSGIFYRATEEYDRPYWSGPEYQLLDDGGGTSDTRRRETAAASVYGLYGGPQGVVTPAGQWNAARIVVNGPHVEHWLNGTKMFEYELGSPEWEARVKASKFGRRPNYGRARRGHISIQGDHTGELAVRNIRIRELK